MDSKLQFYAFLIVLAVWAIGNITLWVQFRNKEKGVRKYALDMSALWNVVNLGIAVAGVVFLLSKEYTAQLVDTQRSIIAWNIFADVVYVVLGTALLTKKPSVKRKGYGYGVIIQGLYLLAFDAIFLAYLTLSA